MIEVDGIEYPSGGNSNQNYENMAPQLEFATKWLMGDITRTDRLELVWRHRFRNQIFFNFKTAAEKINEKINLYYGLQMNISY